MKSQIALIVASGLILSSGRAVIASAHWPQFRGPNSSGVADDSKPPTVFGPGTNQLWKTEVSRGVSSPCVWGDHIFLTTVEDGKPTTLCVNRHDGKVRWRRTIAADLPQEIHKANHPASATPATDGKSVVAYFATFGLLTYDFEGRELWRNPTPGLLARNGSGTSPAILDGRLVLNCDVEDGKSFLAAFDPATGKQLWRTPRPDFISSYTTPILWQHDGAAEIVIVGSLRVVGYGWNDGKQRWSIGGTEAVSVCPTPVLGEGQLYVMSRSFGGMGLPAFAVFALASDKNGDGKISRAEAPRQLAEQGIFNAVDTDHDGFIVDQEWAESAAFLSKGEHGIFALKPPGEGELSTNQVAWKHKKGVAPVSSPLFYRGRVYVVQDGGRLTCFQAKNGEKLFEQERLGVDGTYHASPIAANGHVYFCSTRGTVTVIAAGDTLAVKARNALGESIVATPAIADDKLYVRTENHLFAFGR